jgi:DNA-binding NarL/FixJ family response regulator
MRSRSVVVIHRQAMVAEGVAAALANHPWIVVVGATTTLVEGVEIGKRADAVALDQYLSGAEGAAVLLRRAGVRVVMLGEALEGAEDVRVSIEAPVAALASALVPGVVGRGEPAVLSRRQHEVLNLVARGMVAKQVARQLGISEKTVEQHKARIFAKLQVPNQAAAVRLAVAHGLEGASR